VAKSPAGAAEGSSREKTSIKPLFSLNFILWGCALQSFESAFEIAISTQSEIAGEQPD